MIRLALILYAMVATTLAGIGVIAVLSLGFSDWAPIVGSAVAGFLLAIPASWFVAKQIHANLR